MRKSMDPRAGAAALQMRDLLTGLRELYGLEVAEGDLARPANVTNMFSVVLMRLKGMPLETMQINGQIIAEKLSENPEAVVDMLYLTILEKRIAEMSAEIGVKEDFGLRDLVRPEPARIARFLRHYMDYSRRTTDIRGVLMRFDDQMNAIQQNALALEGHVFESNKELDSLRRNQRNDSLKAIKKREDLDKLAQEVSSSQKTATLNQTALDGLYTQQDEWKKQVSQREFECRFGEDEIRARRRCIISDARKARETMEIHRDKLSKATSMLNSNYEKSTTMTTRQAEVLRAIPESEELIRSSREFIACEKGVQEDTRKLQLVTEEMDMEEAKYRDRIQRIKELEQQNETQRTKLSNLAEVFRAKQSQLSADFACVKTEYVKVTQEEQECRHRIERCRNAVESLAAAAKEHQEQSHKYLEILGREATDSKAWGERYIETMAGGLSKNAIFIPLE